MSLSDSDREIIRAITAILDALGPIHAKARREEKWRRADQLANEIDRPKEGITIDRVADVLTRYEAAIRDRMKHGLPPDAVVRRATYPDGTTVLPLWGSTKHHGQPWLEQSSANRVDEPSDIPTALQLPEEAPCVFLSHTSQDTDLAFRLASDIARLGFRSWMFETHIEQRGPIAECVRTALATCKRCLALVTRDSIASLWVLTELQTALKAGTPVTLVLDASDEALVRLFESVRFSHAELRDDLSVLYDAELVAQMRDDYTRRHSSRRANAYQEQARDFLATLPVYLSGRTAIAYPRFPTSWRSVVPLSGLNELERELATASRRG
jgi:hypothetical protein